MVSHPSGSVLTIEPIAIVAPTAAPTAGAIHAPVR
jgi:hypothetical protein